MSVLVVTEGAILMVATAPVFVLMRMFSFARVFGDGVLDDAQAAASTSALEASERIQFLTLLSHPN
jgi:hypothetical protein